MKNDQLQAALTLAEYALSAAAEECSGGDSKVAEALIVHWVCQARLSLLMEQTRLLAARPETGVIQ